MPSVQEVCKLHGDFGKEGGFSLLRPLALRKVETKRSRNKIRQRGDRI